MEFKKNREILDNKISQIKKYFLFLYISLGIIFFIWILYIQFIKINKLKNNNKEIENTLIEIEDKIKNNNKEIKNNLIEIGEIKKNNNEIKNNLIEIEDKIKKNNKEIKNNLIEIKDKIKEQNPDIKSYLPKVKEIINKPIEQHYKKTIKNYKLIFQASTDGYSAKDFHDKCDGKSFTVTIILSKVGRIFGGYSEPEWDQSNTYKTGFNFIFSYDHKAIYYNNCNDKGIKCEKDYGPIFGYYDIRIDDNVNRNYYNMDDTSHPECCYKNVNNLLAESKFFSIRDYVVYQIEFN